MIWEYKFKKGKHRSQCLIGSRDPLRRTGNFSVMVDKAFADGQSEYFISKLYGFADGFHHHKNSIRIGIRHNPLTNKCMFYAYYYINSIRHFHLICEKEYNVWVDCSIEFGGSAYYVKVDAVQTICHREGKFKSYALYPYYGGKYPAKQDFSIYMQFFD
jgi:hypothetical protein